MQNVRTKSRQTARSWLASDQLAVAVVELDHEEFGAAKPVHRPAWFRLASASESPGSVDGWRIWDQFGPNVRDAVDATPWVGRVSNDHSTLEPRSPTDPADLGVKGSQVQILSARP
ncbi:hypothetical protein GCM10022236_42880 [Microlunatus ginsengisoli]|uniref:Uncharacterized protein n=1 Tax=Microlunatus ginsengisoli TaxID=363863 RepID=A0ABP7AM03_9ACTN